MYDEKIINSLIDNFEAASPRNNRYIILKTDDDTALTHVKRQNGVSAFNVATDDINDAIREINSNILICHVLDPISAKVLLKVERKMKVFWSIWGYDLYSLPRIKPGLYAPLTLKYITRQSPLKRVGWKIYNYSALRKFYFSLKGKDDPFLTLDKAHALVKACLTYVREDYELLKKHYPSIQAGYIHQPFLNINQYLGKEIRDEISNGNNILIGNSNSVESNHLDVFNIIHQALEPNANIIVPLSYGANPKYKSEVLKTGTKMFKANFQPILEFTSLEKYVKMLSSCSVGIFYHYRQQAMGNIIAMLWLGSRVYMHEQNPAYRYLKRIGLKVFVLQNDFPVFGTSRLAKEEIDHNRLALSSSFSTEIVAEQYMNVVKLCEEYDA